MDGSRTQFKGRRLSGKSKAELDSLVFDSDDGLPPKKGITKSAACLIPAHPNPSPRKSVLKARCRPRLIERPKDSRFDPVAFNEELDGVQSDLVAIRDTASNMLKQLEALREQRKQAKSKNPQTLLAEADRRWRQRLKSVQRRLEQVRGRSQFQVSYQKF